MPEYGQPFGSPQGGLFHACSMQHSLGDRCVTISAGSSSSPSTIPDSSRDRRRVDSVLRISLQQCMIPTDGCDPGTTTGWRWLTMGINRAWQAWLHFRQFNRRAQTLRRAQSGETGTTDALVVPHGAITEVLVVNLWHPPKISVSPPTPETNAFIQI